VCTYAFSYRRYGTGTVLTDYRYRLQNPYCFSNRMRFRQKCATMPSMVSFIIKPHLIGSKIYLMAPTTAAHRLSGGSPIPEQDEFVRKMLRIIFVLFLILEGISVRDP
jgi:hypothetical protein